MTGSRAPLGVLVIIVLFGAYVRLAHLGERTLGADELNHLYAATSLEETGRPQLPSGARFARGIDVIRMQGVALRLGLSPATAVRLPSAVFGVLGLLLFAMIAWRMVGPWAAVWATLLLAVLPELVSQARHSRFYTYQMVFGIGALWTGWRAVQHDGPAGSERGRGQVWAWMLATMVLFALTFRVQVVALSAFAAWVVILAVRAVLDVRESRARRWWSHPRVQFLLGMAVLGMLTVLVNPALPMKLARSAMFVAQWAEGGRPLFYYHRWSGTLPVVMSLAPVIFLVVWLKREGLAAFLTAWFGIPLLLHTFVFPWKGERFVLIPMLGLLLAVGVVVAEGAGALREALMRWHVRRQMRGRPQVTSGVLVAFCSLFLIVTTPAFNMSRKLVREEGPRWDLAAAIVRGRADLADLPLGSSQPIESKYYFGRTDFGMSLYLYHQREEMGLPGGLVEGGGDFYTNTPIYVHPRSVAERFAGHGGILIAVDGNRWEYGDFPPAMAGVLEREALELCGGGCGTLHLFHWNPDSPR